MAQSTSYQLVVLGAGPGGYAAAFLAADMGMKVALVDREDNPGGVCLYRGCIPSKALLHASRILAEADHAAAIGITFGKPRVDLDRLRAWKEEVVAAQTGGLGQLLKARKIDHVQGTGRFVDARTIDVATSQGKKSVTFDNAIIATGSSPATIPMFDIGSPRILDSTGALALDEVPASLLVVGGGYIGLELGSVYAALGSKVSVVEMMPGLLPGADRDLVKVLEKRIKESFASIMVDTRVVKVEEGKKGVKVILEGAGAGTNSYDRVLVSVGRRPNSSNLGLENTRVAVDERGLVVVDNQMRTAEPSIFAIGDVVGDPMLAHKAAHEGRTAVEVMSGAKVAFEPAAIPAVIFTDPEIAWAGITENQAKEQGRELSVVKFPWAASGRATTIGRSDGLTKLLVDPATERVLGVGIVGVGAGDLIAEGVLAIEMAALASDIRHTIHPHPTLSETVMEAAEVFYGQSSHIYRPRRK